LNYKSELRGFALDRALRVLEVTKPLVATSEDVLAQADKIVEYLYIPDKDIKSHLDTLLPLIVQTRDLDRIDALILDLQQIRAEMAADVGGAA
jgi:hypothetical protein